MNELDEHIRESVKDDQFETVLVTLLALLVLEEAFEDYEDEW